MQEKMSYDEIIDVLNFCYLMLDTIGLKLRQANIIEAVKNSKIPEKTSISQKRRIAMQKVMRLGVKEEVIKLKQEFKKLKEKKLTNHRMIMNIINEWENQERQYGELNLVFNRSKKKIKESKMQEYHKIQSIFKRDRITKKGKFLIGQWTIPEFEYLKDNIWVFTEKVNGMNIRINFDGNKINYGGKTDNAQLPMDLIIKLQDIFEPKIELFKSTFIKEEENDNINVTFYGEGYGAGIQKGGGNYKKEKDFVLFDILINNLWLQRKDIQEIAEVFNVDAVPIIGEGTIQDAIDLVKGGFNSVWGDFLAEGIVLRPKIEFRTRRGDRMITKIKHNDFYNKGE